jgi:predicted transcriptional regulator
MCQEGVLNFLSKSKDRKYTIQEIAKGLNKTTSSINCSVRRLIRWNLINHTFDKPNDKCRFAEQYLIWAKV